MTLQLINLTRRFGKNTAVDHLDLTIENGVYGLLGVNGAGKTTLMRMICTLLKPSDGQILCNGQDIFEMDGEYRKLLGYLPQDFGFYPEFTVTEYLRYIASIKGMRPGTAARRIRELLTQVGLENAAHKKMKALSGGMKRRAGIAQALLNDPKILILDEPTAGLDPAERVRLRNLLGQLSRDRIIILSTHIVSDVEYIANEIWLMREGRLMYRGTLEKILASMEVTVWQCHVPQHRANAMLERFQVSNMKSLGNLAALRILSPVAPAPEAVAVEPTLEDVFLYCFGQRGGGEG